MKKIGMYLCAAMLILGTLGCEKNSHVGTNNVIEDDYLTKTDELDEDEIEIPSKLEVLRFWANNFNVITGEPEGVYDIGNILVMDFDCDSMPELLVERFNGEAGLYYYDTNIALEGWTEYHIDNVFGESGIPSAEIKFAFFDGTNINYILNSQTITYTDDGQMRVIIGYENLSINIEDKDKDGALNSLSVVKYASYGLEETDYNLSTSDPKFYDENGNEVSEREYCDELTFPNYSKSHSKENEYIDYYVEPLCVKLEKTADLEVANLYMLFDESYKASVLNDDAICDYKSAIEGSWICTKIEYSNKREINKLENESIVLNSKDGIVNLSVDLEDFKEDYEDLEYYFYYDIFTNVDAKYFYKFEDKTIGIAYLSKDGSQLIIVRNVITDEERVSEKWFFERTK